MEKEIHNCPTCGSKVTVEGDVTKHYVPITDLIHKYQDAYEIIRHRMETELLKARDKAHEKPTLPAERETVTFRHMVGNYWCDENNWAYIRDEKSKAFTLEPTAK